ncbi:hypothetical protein CYMTET_24088 [Cymbomonas tetramitiformis]|uniref:Uncharacterized protein n=1 Tax=Cymbomonas tetramitiformis TaxID=36881 RepID=A0AAE0L092_9CHLO|nr:hypothetical protein CYMTET_24088 [Cymbomonas tetramitiformis]
MPCTGDFTAFPADTLKVRMQNAGGRAGISQTCYAVWQSGGIRAVYSGVNASIFRQFTYGGLRLSLYQPIRDALAGRDNKTPSAGLQILAGGASGAIASAICTPADVVKLRLQAGSAHYRGVGHALYTIASTEGIPKLWRGVGPTSTRAAVVAGVELGCYDFFKTRAMHLYAVDDGPLLHMGSAVVSTLVAVSVSFPIDVAKTRMINQSVGIKDPSAVVYRNMLDCVLRTATERGFLGLYQGVSASFLRQLVCNVVTFMSYEQLKNELWIEGWRGDVWTGKIAAVLQTY